MVTTALPCPVETGGEMRQGRDKYIPYYLDRAEFLRGFRGKRYTPKMESRSRCLCVEKKV